MSLGEGQPIPAKYAGHSLKDEVVFLGWQHGAVPPHLRAMFDDFVDSSEMGMRYVVPGALTYCIHLRRRLTRYVSDRKPEPEFYLLACKRNNISPREAVFLDDLGM